jgi:hypothetical protein
MRVATCYWCSYRRRLKRFSTMVAQIMLWVEHTKRWVDSTNARRLKLHIPIKRALKGWRRRVLCGWSLARLLAHHGYIGPSLYTVCQAIKETPKPHGRQHEGSSSTCQWRSRSRSRTPGAGVGELRAPRTHQRNITVSPVSGVMHVRCAVYRDGFRPELDPGWRRAG